MRQITSSVFISIIVGMGLIVAGCQESAVTSSKESSNNLADLPGSSHNTNCDISVPGDNGSVQGAIDNASSDDVVCVDSGTYAEDITLDKDITLQGTADPAGSNPAMVDGLISVSADGATVTSLKVAPSTTYASDRLQDPSGFLITASDVLIKGNLITGVTGNASGAIHGIQVWNDGPLAISSVKIRDNTITDIHNKGDAGNYGGAAGIKVQGAAKDVEVSGNNVRDVRSAGWVFGVTLTHTGNNPSVSPEEITVRMNTLEALNNGSDYNVFDDPLAAPYPGVAFAIDDTENPTGPGGADADQATVELNNFLNTPIGTQNKDEVHTLIAECNYWGHASGPSDAKNNANKGAQVSGDVDFRPWSVRQINNGKKPAKSCVGGKNR